MARIEVDVYRLKAAGEKLMEIAREADRQEIMEAGEEAVMAAKEYIKAAEDVRVLLRSLL
ncbi:hypothetical protein [Butyrivibrio sp. MC2013]|uniref:hypothetical protein n=1 Tax=Butyrivibrio sp. MC2013 TaxID=1280686 RepID=UPI00042A9221|nr:hypothetical protein [Butyrivibrio sp. MC2013]